MSSTNNLELNWWLLDKSRNKSGPNIEPWGTPALVLAQDELWPLRITIVFYFLRSLLEGLVNSWDHAAFKLKNDFVVPLFIESFQKVK